MHTIDKIKSAIATVDGVVFRKSAGLCELDAVKRHQFGSDGMVSATEEFEKICALLSEIGNRRVMSGEFGRDATYMIGNFQVRITVTGGTYSAPLLGISAVGFA